MTDKKIWLGMLVMVLTFGMAVIGCDDGSIEETMDAEYPKITVQPVDGGPYLPGAAIPPLSVTASVSDGGTLTYQWHQSGFSGFTTVPGAIANTFTPPNTTAGTRAYRVEVTNTNSSAKKRKTSIAMSESSMIVTGWEYGKIEGRTGYGFWAKSMVFANNLFVAVVGGDYVSGDQIGWSDDGIKWKLVENTIFGNNRINGIAYGNNRFIAVGSGGKMASSIDGKTWTSLDGFAAFHGRPIEEMEELVLYGIPEISAIAYGNNRFVAATGYDGVQTAYLTDGNSTWTVKTVNIIQTKEKDYIVYGANKFMMRGYTGYPLYKYVWIPLLDGETTWGRGQFVSDFGWKGQDDYFDLVSANNYIVAFGAGGNVWKQTGTTTWTDISPSSIFGTERIDEAAYAAGKLFVSSATKSAWSGDDGVTWTELPYRIGVSGMVYGAGRLVTGVGGYCLAP
jgi:hypothetical protein